MFVCTCTKISWTENFFCSQILKVGSKLSYAYEGKIRDKAVPNIVNLSIQIPCQFRKRYVN